MLVERPAGIVVEAPCVGPSGGAWKPELRGEPALSEFVADLAGAVDADVERPALPERFVDRLEIAQDLCDAAGVRPIAIDTEIDRGSRRLANPAGLIEREQGVRSAALGRERLKAAVVVLVRDAQCEAGIQDRIGLRFRDAFGGQARLVARCVVCDDRLDAALLDGGKGPGDVLRRVGDQLEAEASRQPTLRRLRDARMPRRQGIPTAHRGA
ncbi:hypothetical protein [Bradyrhizobium sp. UFLA03-84]|uniref:hypothetical protein n=1 Tax=Bradyrhizobium sp. UFLA03-84 TaxID=418599 RepID=UPI001FD9F981|nr:hypothetical protein [Bradyrhizobium sp. UFLA03-84]